MKENDNQTTGNKISYIQKKIEMEQYQINIFGFSAKI